jgi:hypothetical protein
LKPPQKGSSSALRNEKIAQAVLQSAAVTIKQKGLQKSFNAYHFYFMTLNLVFITALLYCQTFTAAAQLKVKDYRGAAAVLPISSEPPPALFVDPPLVKPLSEGRVVIQYYTKNLRIAPVYGTAALQVTPRIGHLHITVDNASWRWIDTSNEPLVINGLQPGPHSVLIEMVDPTHKRLDAKKINFIIPHATKSLHPKN